MKSAEKQSEFPVAGTHRASGARRAFTLIELLVAMAVLAIVLVLMLQISGGVLDATKLQSRQMEAVGAARRALDVIRTDIERAVVNDGATVLVPDGIGGSGLAAVTARRGATPAGDHRFLAVRYSLANQTLTRSYGSVGFGETNLIRAAANTPGTARSLAPGVLAVHVGCPASAVTNSYNGLAVPTGFLAVRAPSSPESSLDVARSLDVWLLAIDDESVPLLAQFGLPALGSDPVKWRGKIDDSSLPPRLKSGIRVLTTTIPLP
jgi:prepilin-type N-terminal cleavage/methylation domain-containing protein